MDLITLKLANKYTKQQIEKASLEGIQLDKTLTKEGFSADAKAVGDALKDISLTPGPQGPQGPQGLQGPRGEAGADGRDGVNGKDGIDGVNGKSAYQYAQDGGYTGTEEEFAQKLASDSTGDKWELIKSYTVTEKTGDLVDIEIDKDLNGEPFALKDIGIKIAKGAAGGEVKIEAYDERSVGYRLAYFPSSNKQSQYYRWFLSDTFVISRWGTAADAASETAGLAFINPVAHVATKILLSGYIEPVFVVGTKIELWGVRA